MKIFSIPWSVGNKSIFSFALSALVFAFCPSATAQQPQKIPRIGFLLAPSRSAVAESLDAFREGMRELGYVEGKNIVIEYRYAEGKLDRLPDLAAELVRLQIDVIVAGGGGIAVQAAKKASNVTPIIFPAIVDPVASGVVASLARPGAILPVFLLEVMSCKGSGWSFSRKRFPERLVWRSSGIRKA
jgi:ABC-type uncharacterized transport system substrate-binding protein